MRANCLEKPTSRLHWLALFTGYWGIYVLGWRPGCYNLQWRPCWGFPDRHGWRFGYRSPGRIWSSIAINFNAIRNFSKGEFRAFWQAPLSTRQEIEWQLWRAALQVYYICKAVLLRDTEREFPVGLALDIYNCCTAIHDSRKDLWDAVDNCSIGSSLDPGQQKIVLLT